MTGFAPKRRKLLFDLLANEEWARKNFHQQKKGRKKGRKLEDQTLFISVIIFPAYTFGRKWSCWTYFHSRRVNVLLIMWQWHHTQHVSIVLHLGFFKIKLEIISAGSLYSPVQTKDSWDTFGQIWAHKLPTLSLRNYGTTCDSTAYQHLRAQRGSQLSLLIGHSTCLSALTTPLTKRQGVLIWHSLRKSLDVIHPANKPSLYLFNESCSLYFFSPVCCFLIHHRKDHCCVC